MNGNIETYTPVSRSTRRSLGLKKSSQKANKTPQSDIAISHSSLQESLSDTTTSPTTPCGSSSFLSRATSSTTHGRPYCLSLSHRVREKYKKKKLEFAAAAQETDACSPSKTKTTTFEPKDDDNEEILNSYLVRADRLQSRRQSQINGQHQPVLEQSNSKNVSAQRDTSPISEDEEFLLKEIKDKEDLLAAHHKHKETVQELQSAIDIWKFALNNSFSQLSAKADPSTKTEDLLVHLGIPTEMNDYIDI